MMKKPLLVLIVCLLGLPAAFTQTVPEKLRIAVQALERDPRMKHAILGLHVIDGVTGLVIFDRNGEAGLAPASCQKLFTSVAAMDLLGPGYRYLTTLGYSGRIDSGVLNGDLVITGSGDPTLGSKRYAQTGHSVVLDRWAGAIGRAGIKSVAGRILADNGMFDPQRIPDGWIWEDIGNYYGAGAGQLNWMENQYDLRLQPGDRIGAAVAVLGTDPFEVMPGGFVSEVVTGAPGSGDNAGIYYGVDGKAAVVRGSVPLQKQPFVISGAMAAPSWVAEKMLRERLGKMVRGRAADGVTGDGLTNDRLMRDGVGNGRRPGAGLMIDRMVNDRPAGAGARSDSLTNARSVIDRSAAAIDTLFSPPLDSINYWFLKKSINLYGEALVRTMGKGSGEAGLTILRDFWVEKGIDRAAMHVVDGCGLSPQNRVTAHALVQTLQYARTRPWWGSFNRSLPVINGMTMKSGSIGGVRSFAGYQRGMDGREYIFGFIVNNYDGAAVEIISRMYKILDIMKGR